MAAARRMIARTRSGAAALVMVLAVVIMASLPGTAALSVMARVTRMPGQLAG